MRRSLAALALAMVLPFPGLAPAAALANVVVKPGETLSEIADRHGVSLTRLMQANGITNPNLVVAGQSLRLPGSSAAGAGSSRGASVTVQPGDTLSDIADRQGISLNQLMQANGITNPDMVVAGQKLVLPGSRRATAAASPRELPTAPYTVKSGETISEIADRFGTSTERLIQLNGISNPNLVVAGTRLAIPGRPSSSAAPRSTAAPRNAKEHVVRSGESLSTIADSYGLPVERLVAINKIDDPDLVMSGARLKLQAPPPVKATPKPATPKPAAAQAKPQTKPNPKPVATATAVATPVAVKTPAPKPTPRPTPSVQQPIQQAIQQPVQQAVQQPVQKAAERAVQPAVQPVVQAAVQPKIQPTPKPSPVVATPIAKASTTSTTATTSPASRPSTGSKPSSSKPQGPDWRSYGPLQVDWANWQPMGGSFVAPTLNSDGKPVYLAVNCGARKLNATSQSGQWKSWDAPQSDFEEQLISDICKARAS
ncbi:LysM peptidoglycan-binding domain-containing protein [Cyanobium sp. BA5m-21]|uniref:LysM peptidoglycan-binding domain-containing protein n=1 Tax=unclassified Cyanobium TaxID=2627006 RepID=UPI0020CBB70F|nr:MULTISPECIES: LysM peptidoglycan-binding domain-containing protein [unclassified Cyanobium]MCP9905366.1 LysM peptidoglycan-binding domain-containing protein [Cyanobium sp. BA5m-10]MCP9907813.1 LysM peptidoglycan-binding domain-containing protein [Cyanobium sp. BA5m-21]